MSRARTSTKQPVVGAVGLGRLLAEGDERVVAATWAVGDPLLQRAALAGVCEPRFLAAPEVARADAARTEQLQDRLR